MAVLEGLVWRPSNFIDMKGRTLFRTLHGHGITLFLDEAERLKGDAPDVKELRAMLLAGYKAGGRATRLEPVGDSFPPVSFDVYGPKALACIEGMPPALASRCITVRMMRAPIKEQRTKSTLDDNPEDAAGFLIRFTDGPLLTAMRL